MSHEDFTILEKGFREYFDGRIAESLFVKEPDSSVHRGQYIPRLPQHDDRSPSIPRPRPGTRTRNPLRPQGKETRGEKLYCQNSRELRIVSTQGWMFLT